MQQKQTHPAKKTPTAQSRSVLYTGYQKSRQKNHQNSQVHQHKTYYRNNSSNTKSNSQPSKTLYTQISYSQPKLQNKRLKYFRPNNSSFFNHLSSTKVIQPKQLLDQSFVNFLDHVQKYKGFKGAKTNSWNQLMYLTPQKRHKKGPQQLTQLKSQLYKTLRTEQHCPKQSEPRQQQIPIRTTLVQFLTQYNPKSMNKTGEDRKQMIGRWHKKPGNVIRQKLKNYQRKSQYRNKMHSYQMFFQGYRIP